jgi:hypothetical protein
MVQHFGQKQLNMDKIVKVSNAPTINFFFFFKKKKLVKNTHIKRQLSELNHDRIDGINKFVASQVANIAMLPKIKAVGQM